MKITVARPVGVGQGFLHAGRQERHERSLGVPRADGHEGRRAERGRGALEVLLRAHGGAVGGEDEADDPFQVGRAQQGSRLLDERVGVLGAERHHVAARRPRLERGTDGVDLRRRADGEG